MPNTKSTLLHTWFEEVWNQGQRGAIEKYLTPDTIAYGFGPEGQSGGIEGFQEFYDGFRKQFGDIHVKLEHVIQQGDFECALCFVTATEKASGTKVDFTGTCFAEIKDGKILHGWNHFDFLKMYQQLGFTLVAPEKKTE
jgi:predicted ester cyclase